MALTYKAAKTEEAKGHVTAARECYELFFHQVFQERKEGSYTNSMKEASDCSCVDCKATNCMYNKECECHAGKISVEGGDAKQASGTECATFQSCIG